MSSSTLTSYLPSHEGWLPTWLLVVTLISNTNSLTLLFNPSAAKKVFSASPSPVTPLVARLFALWSVTSAIVRGYTAYHIDNPELYNVAIATFVLALVYFLSELFVFGGTKIGPGLISPLLVASSSAAWMITQREFYTGQ